MNSLGEEIQHSKAYLCILKLAFGVQIDSWGGFMPDCSAALPLCSSGISSLSQNSFSKSALPSPQRQIKWAGRENAMGIVTELIPT